MRYYGIDSAAQLNSMLGPSNILNLAGFQEYESSFLAHNSGPLMRKERRNNNDTAGA